MDEKIIAPININSEMFNKDIEKVNIPIPDEYKDDTNEEAEIKYGIR